MKKNLLLFVSLLFIIHSYAEWGNDVLVHQGQPTGTISATNRSGGVVYAAVPDNQNANFAIVIYKSLDYGATWSAFSGAGTSGITITKTKMLTSGTDSAYLFYLMNNEIHSLNVESGTVGVYNVEPVRDFDVAAALDGSLFLIVDILVSNQLRRFGSFDGGATWSGNNVITSNGAHPTIYKSSTSDTMIINYYGTINASDTSASLIRAARYVQTGPGTYSPATSGFTDVILADGKSRKQFKTVFNNGTAWLFYTEGDTLQEIKYRLSTDGGFTYSNEIPLAGNQTVNHSWFDAHHANLGFIGSGVIISWYYDSLQTGPPTMQSDKIVIAEASNALPTNFSTPESISEQSPLNAGIVYKPDLVVFEGGSFDDRGVLWTGLDGSNTNVYWDLSTFISSVNNLNKNDFAINVYPNPAKNKITISFNKKQNEDVLITLNDATGKMINKIKLQNFVDDNFEMELNDLNAGIYFLNIKTNSGLQTKRIVISK